MRTARQKAKIEFIKSVVLNPGSQYPKGHTYREEGGRRREVHRELEAAGLVDPSGLHMWEPSDELKSAMDVAINNAIIDELEEWGLY